MLSVIHRYREEFPTHVADADVFRDYVFYGSILRICRHPFLERCRCLTDVNFGGLTLLCLSGVTIDNVASLLRTLTMQIVSNEQVHDSPIFVVD